MCPAGKDLFGAEPFDPFICGAADFPPDIQSRLDEMQVTACLWIVRKWTAVGVQLVEQTVGTVAKRHSTDSHLAFPLLSVTEGSHSWSSGTAPPPHLRQLKPKDILRIWPAGAVSFMYYAQPWSPGWMCPSLTCRDEWTYFQSLPKQLSWNWLTTLALLSLLCSRTAVYYVCGNGGKIWFITRYHSIADQYCSNI